MLKRVSWQSAARKSNVQMEKIKKMSMVEPLVDKQNGLHEEDV